MAEFSSAQRQIICFVKTLWFTNDGHFKQGMWGYFQMENCLKTIFKNMDVHVCEYYARFCWTCLCPYLDIYLLLLQALIHYNEKLRREYEIVCLLVRKVTSCLQTPRVSVNLWLTHPNTTKYIINYVSYRRLVYQIQDLERLLRIPGW